jgi:hypothetical protein
VRPIVQIKSIRQMSTTIHLGLHKFKPMVLPLAAGFTFCDDQYCSLNKIPGSANICLKIKY